ncbi:VOC family protein [Halomicrococcus sp. SG-WS-1]|uniref:VOC family protein n=1 Tax=Halomicrococcus sp. SG-WS-1 TaxID=3439057 RepID=UPI003F793D54
MLAGLRWLALEAKYLDRARSFYETHLDLSARESDGEVAFEVGDHRLVLREPGGVPRGGLHTHFAFAAPADRYDEWYDCLDGEFDLVEHEFGSARSLYFYDPDGNCVEIGGGGDGDEAITGIFEIVLEVEDVERAESFYGDLGFETYDRGSDRRRVRMGGPVDLELWEPQLGIADARGGVHVDVGFDADDPNAAAERVADRACDVRTLSDGVRVRDPDGHSLTFR